MKNICKGRVTRKDLLSDLKTYYEVMVIKRVWYYYSWNRQKHHYKKTESKNGPSGNSKKGISN